MVCAEHPIGAIANFVVFRSLASARRARPRAPSPARLRCVSCEGRGAQQGGALSVWVVPQIEANITGGVGVLACECRHGNAVIIMVCGHAKSFMQGACRARLGAWQLFHGQILEWRTVFGEPQPGYLSLSPLVYERMHM